VLAASFFLGVLVQLLWPSTAMRRLVVPAVFNVALIVGFLVPGIYIWLDAPILSLAATFLFAAWISGAVLTERFVPQRVTTLKVDEVSDPTRLSSSTRKV
jgi:hypothetical protein